eukprot:1160320-Pelagomonas_calceolata.AAC.6
MREKLQKRGLRHIFALLHTTVWQVRVQLFATTTSIAKSLPETARSAYVCCWACTACRSGAQDAGMDVSGAQDAGMDATAGALQNTKGQDVNTVF